MIPNRSECPYCKEELPTREIQVIELEDTKRVIEICHNCLWKRFTCQFCEGHFGYLSEQNGRCYMCDEERYLY
jgi:hypothetical protein